MSRSVKLALDEKPMATDPAVAEAQRKAMYAAANGKSTLGIPKKVGKEFTASDATAGHAAGIVFVAPDGDVLLLRRASTETNYAGHWALPGGKGDDGETPEQTADREATEEMGPIPNGRKKILDRRITPNGMAFHTFAQSVDKKFAPTLNDEHSGFAWAPLNQLPEPMHPSVKSTLTERIEQKPAADMSPEDWDGLRTGFAKWTREEEREAEHANDERIAFDLKSVRSYDEDGHLHVARTPVSKANVGEYFGNEIPDSEDLGLDPSRKYRLLRDPKELEKGAASLNGKQLLIKHVPVNADDHQPDLTVGAVGTDAEYVHPYLYNSITVHAREGIDGIEDGSRRELSCAYRYKADMTPGVYEGVGYDGVMREISFNHLALVPSGRAGADVMVGDSIHGMADVADNKETAMTKPVVLSRKAAVTLGALVGYLKPKLAQDAKLNFYPILADVTAKNFKDKKASILSGLKSGTAGKLAKDASIDDVAQLLDALECEEVMEGADSDPNSGLPMSKEDMEKKAKDKKAKDAEPDGKAKEFLKGKLSAEDMKAYDDMMGAAEDGEAAKATENTEGAEKGGKDADPDDKDDKEPKVTKKAMDEAISLAEKRATSNALKTANEIAHAREFVAPWVGKLAMDASSAADIYKTALDQLKVDVDGVHPSAFKRLLEAQQQPGQRARMASDAAPDATGFEGRFGALTNRIAFGG